MTGRSLDRAVALALVAAAPLSAQVIREQRPDSPWPAVTIVAFIAASPEEAAAVFTDYDRHADFIPGTKRSKVSRVISPTDVEVDYVVAVPIVSDEEYTVRDVLSRDGPGGYRVDWTLVRASSTKATVGHARFVPALDSAGRAGTRFEYHNFVTPGSRLASLGFIRNRALRQMEETAVAIRTRIETQHRDTAAVASRLAMFRGLWNAPRP